MRKCASWLAVLAATCGLLAQGCAVSRSSSGAPGNTQVSPASSFPTRFQFVYVIHGDAGYAYFDQNGKRHLADSEAESQAEEVGLGAKDAEVLIFHQRPKHLWGLPGGQGSLRLYRNGRLERTAAYARKQDGMQAEADLFRKYASPAEHRSFFYFGHEIPESNGIPYSRSQPELAFTLASFAAGLRSFAAPMRRDSGKPFDLVALSACHGGTPTATRTLAPFAAWLIASPGELHLTYLDTRALIRLTRENPPRSARIDAGAWGKALVSSSFSRLCENTSTSVTVALYESDRAAAYLDAHRKGWEITASGTGQTRGGPQASRDHRDCAENPGFGAGGLEAGVTLLFRAPLFGPDKNKSFTSGWECPGPPAT